MKELNGQIYNNQLSGDIEQIDGRNLNGSISVHNISGRISHHRLCGGISAKQISGILKYAVQQANVKLQHKSIDVTQNGTAEILPDAGFDGLSQVDVNVNVPIPEGYIQPSGTMRISANGDYDVASYAGVTVAVESTGGGGGSGLANRITGYLTAKASIAESVKVTGYLAAQVTVTKNESEGT